MLSCHVSVWDPQVPVRVCTHLKYPCACTGGATLRSKQKAPRWVKRETMKERKGLYERAFSSAFPCFMYRGPCIFISYWSPHIM